MKLTLRVLKTLVPELTPLEVAKLGVLVAYIKEQPGYLTSPHTGLLHNLLWGLSAPIAPELFGVFGTQVVKAKLKHALDVSLRFNLNLTEAKPEVAKVTTDSYPEVAKVTTDSDPEAKK